MAEEVLQVSPLLFLLLLLLILFMCQSVCPHCDLSIPVPLASKVSEHPLVLSNCRDGDVQLTQAVLSPPLFRLMNVEETMDMQ